MKKTKAMLEKENDDLWQQLVVQQQRCQAAERERDIYKQVSQRTDTALISAQRLSEAASEVAGSAIRLLDRRIT